MHLLTEYLGAGWHGRRGWPGARAFPGPVRLGWVVALLVLTATLGTAVWAGIPMDAVETWTAPGLAGWTGGTPTVALTNSSGCLRMTFAAQAVPVSDYCTVGRSLEEGVMVTNVAFRFLAADQAASAVRVVIHTAGSGHEWSVTVPVPPAGGCGWVDLNVPVRYDAGWSIGPCKSAAQFAQDMLTADAVGVYVRRSGSAGEESYSLDDFEIQGALADSDGDSLPDAWEKHYGLDPSNALDAAADADGDGMSNYAEYIAGTDPTNALSVLRFSGISMSNGKLCLEWVGGTGTVHFVDQSAITDGAWSNVDARVPLSAATNRVFLAPTSDMGIYRVRTARP